MKRFKNMISAYESRLLKRARVEDISDQLNVRTTQIQSILRILQRELRPQDLIRVTTCIRQETPQLVRGASLANIHSTDSAVDAIVKEHEHEYEDEQDPDKE